MSDSRRKKRMSRSRRRGGSTGMMLTSLMDIFTVLVLYLIVNQGTGVTLDSPKTVKIPESVVETAPRRSLVMAVSGTDVFLQGDAIFKVADVLESKDDYIQPIRLELLRLKNLAAEQGDKGISESSEITILADRGVPFKILKKLMSTSSSAGFDKISLAVNQKENQN
jgi:biopolymer transport protein ExbD